MTLNSTNRVSTKTIATVVENTLTGQKSLYAAAEFQQGEVICQFSAAETFEHPTYLTLQIGMDKHITLLPEFLQYTNHSCDPSAFFDTSRMELICLTALQPGDEITFFYPSTEWEMAQPFSCNCGSTNCLQVINGASQIPLHILAKYKLNEFIRQELMQAKKDL